jgi:hypothetical protein
MQHDAVVGRALGLDAVLHRVRDGAGHRPDRLSGAAAMTDIVEQLCEELDDVRADAALLRAEIERLRDALKAIECHSIDHTDACRMAGKARRALET